MTVGKKMKEAWDRYGTGRTVWSHLHADDRRTLSSGVPFWTQPFHRLKLDLPQGREAWGAVTIYTPSYNFRNFQVLLFTQM